MKEYTVSEVANMYLLNNYDVYNHIRLNRVEIALIDGLHYGPPKTITAEAVLIIIKKLVDYLFYEKCLEHFKKTGDIIPLRNHV